MIETTAISYRMDLTVDHFLAVEKKDDDLLLCGGGLCEALIRAGCENVEYSGHYGPSIFFTLAGTDHGEKLKEVESVINNYIK